MATEYRLVGYDRATEFLEASYPVPTARLAAVKRAAGLHPADAALMGDWPLVDSMGREIARLIGQVIDLGQMQYFLERNVAEHRRRRGSA